MDLQAAKQEILKRIKTYDNFAVLVSDPDSDAIGSGLAMHEILKQLNKKVKLYSSFEIPRYSYLPKFENFIIQDITTLNCMQFKTIIVLDSSTPERVLPVSRHLEKFRFPEKSFVINIDHHPSNSLFADINYVPLISSAGEALYDIFADKITITPSLATNLLAAIIGDTHCFRHSAITTPKTLQTAAILMERGARHRDIVQHIFYSFELSTVKDNLDLLQNIKIKRTPKYSFVYAIIENKGTKKLGRDRRHIAEDAMRGIEGTNFSLKITPLKSNLTKLSFRSRDKQILQIVQHFGGGGHKEAGGAVVRMSKEECLEELIKYLQDATLPEAV